MNFAEYVKTHTTRVLNLGCGKTGRPEWFDVDMLDGENVDMVCDVSDGIPLPDNTFHWVFAIDFLEHLKPEKNIKIMEEIYRVLLPGGKTRIEVPSTDGNNIGAFQDPTHYSFWNQMKFRYFLDDSEGSNFRSIYNIRCFFHPDELTTYWNNWNVTYVKALLRK